MRTCASRLVTHHHVVASALVTPTPGPLQDPHVFFVCFVGELFRLRSLGNMELWDECELLRFTVAEALIASTLAATLVHARRVVFSGSGARLACVQGDAFAHQETFACDEPILCGCWAGPHFLIAAFLGCVAAGVRGEKVKL